MAGTTTRLGLPYDELTDNADIEDAVKSLADDLDTKAVTYAQGLVGSLPAAGTQGRFYYATDTEQLYYDDGVAWFKLPYTQTVDTDSIQTNAVTSLKLADGAVTNTKLGTSAVTEAKILDTSITTAKINDSAVTTAKIADSAITAAKIATAVDQVTTAGPVTTNSTSYGTATSFAVTCPSGYALEFDWIAEAMCDGGVEAVRSHLYTVTEAVLLSTTFQLVSGSYARTGTLTAASSNTRFVPSTTGSQTYSILFSTTNPANTARMQNMTIYARLVRL